MITEVRNFNYDVAGNTLNNGLAEFAYNERDWMASTIANGLTTECRYNALRQRVSKENNDESTEEIGVRPAVALQCN